MLTACAKDIPRRIPFVRNRENQPVPMSGKGILSSGIRGPWNPASKPGSAGPTPKNKASTCCGSKLLGFKARLTFPARPPVPDRQTSGLGMFPLRLLLKALFASQGRPLHSSGSKELRRFHLCASGTGSGADRFSEPVWGERPGEDGSLRALREDPRGPRRSRTRKRPMHSGRQFLCRDDPTLRMNGEKRSSSGVTCPCPEVTTGRMSG
jgi:hypothetical protein